MTPGDSVSENQVMRNYTEVCTTIKKKRDRERLRYEKGEVYNVFKTY